MHKSIVIASEAVLSLYPILIKTVPTGLTTQLLSRFLTFSLAAGILAKPSALKETWGTWGGTKRSLGLGTITLSHVATSYYAFEQLPAGVAMSLFYTYPFWNLLGGALFFGESISTVQAGLMLVAFLGAVLVSFGSQESSENDKKTVNWKGVGAALAAAITETAMYFGVRTAKLPDPYFATLELYPGALLGLLAYLGLSRFTGAGAAPAIDTRPSIWAPITLFNLFIGFLGYALRFYAIPNLSTAVFSLLSFVGVISAFLFGWMFVGEKPTLLSAIGAFLISAAAAAVGKNGV